MPEPTPPPVDVLVSGTSEPHQPGRFVRAEPVPKPHPHTPAEDNPCTRTQPR